MQMDLVAVLGTGKITGSRAGFLGTQFNRVKRSLRRQALRQAERTVAGKSPDFKNEPGLNQLTDHRKKTALQPPAEHMRLRVIGQGKRVDFRQQGRLIRTELFGICVYPLVDNLQFRGQFVQKYAPKVIKPLKRTDLAPLLEIRLQRVPAIEIQKMFGNLVGRVHHGKQIQILRGNVPLT
jgi:hypothetical protein